MKYTFSTDNPLKQKAFEEKMWREVAKESFFVNHMGSIDGSGIVHKVNAFEKKKGDEVVIGLIVYPKDQDGVGEGERLRGREVKITDRDMSFKLKRRRNATIHAVMDEQRNNSYSIKAEERTYLKQWAVDYIDKRCWQAASSGCTISFIYDGSSSYGPTAIADAKSNITASSLLSPEYLLRLRAYATSWNVFKKQGRHPLRPVVIKGKKYFVLLVSDDVMAGWEMNADVQDMYSAVLPRSKDHPLLERADYVYKDIIIMRHDIVPTYTNGGAGGDVCYSPCMLLGAQAIAFAWGEKPNFKPDTDDYEEDMGLAYRMTAGWKGSEFKNDDGVTKEYGRISCYLAGKNVTNPATIS